MVTSSQVTDISLQHCITTLFGRKHNLHIFQRLRLYNSFGRFARHRPAVVLFSKNNVRLLHNVRGALSILEE
jgi:hypothetical protein